MRTLFSRQKPKERSMNRVVIWVLDFPVAIAVWIDEVLEKVIERIQLLVTVPAMCEHEETRIAIRDEEGVVVSLELQNGVAKECHICRIAQRGR